MQWYELGPFTVFDVETTGLSATRDRIVELAACRIDRDGSTRCFHSLVNPGRRIPPEVIKIHHITDEMVSGAPYFGDVGCRFLDFAAGSTLAAHNARFDLSFLQEELNRCGQALWQGRTIDTLRLLRTAFPGLSSYRLQNLRRCFNLKDRPDSAAHRAGSDVDWTVQLLELALERTLENQRCVCSE